MSLTTSDNLNKQPQPMTNNYQAWWISLIALALLLNGCSQNQPDKINLKTSDPLKYLLTLHIDSLWNNDPEKNFSSGILRWEKEVRYQTYFSTPYQFQEEQESLIKNTYNQLKPLTGLNIQKVNSWKKTNTALLFAKDWRFEIAYKIKWYKEGEPKLAKMTQKEFVDYLYKITASSEKITRAENGYTSHYFLISNFIKPKNFCFLQNAIFEGFIPDKYEANSPLKETIFNHQNQCNENRFFALDKAVLNSFYSPQMMPFFGETLSSEQIKSFKQKLIELTLEYLETHNDKDKVLKANSTLFK